MKRRLFMLAWTLTLGVGLVLPAGMLGVAAQTIAPAEVVRAALDAYNAADIEKMRTLFAPGTRILSEPGTPLERVETFDQFTTPPLLNIGVVNLQQTGPDTVVVDFVLSGGQLPPLPHPWTGRMTFTVANGLIASVVQVTSEQTVEDVTALMGAQGGQPGMPSTGGRPQSLLVTSLAVGLLCVVVGTIIRRSYLRTR